ncbi:MAG: response regulator [Bacteroidales bacterium]|nr:response regulator [Bacteroidales bacterium]
MSGKSQIRGIRTEKTILNCIFLLISLTVFIKTVFSSDHNDTAENLSYSTRHISISNGLPSNVVTAILKDDHGLIWFGTSKGLCRWDGISAMVFQQNQTDSSSLIGNCILRNGLSWDKGNRHLIVGTKEGVSMFNPLTGICMNYYVNPAESRSIPAPVNVVFNDRQGVLWAGTDKGFSRFNPLSGDFSSFHFDKNLPEGIILDRISTNMIHDICQDLNNDSILWLASLAGLLKFNKNTESLLWFYYPEVNYLREINQFTLIVPHPDGKLYLSTWNFDMVVFDTQTEKFTGRTGTSVRNEPSITNRIVPYAVRPDGDVWVSSLQGLGILNSQTGKINFIQSFKNESGHRFAPELFFTDTEGQLWLGSEFGVFVLNPGNHPVKNYFIDPEDEDHWYLNLSIYEDTLHKELLIGYGRGEGLHYFDLETNTFGTIPYEQRILSEYNITEIIRLQNGEIIFLAADEIYQYFPDIKKAKALKYPYTHFPAFSDIQQDPKGRIWVASGNLGLQQYNAENNTVKNIRNWNDIFITGHELPLFGELCIDPQNRIWFRRRGESYGYYDPKTDSLRYFKDVENKYDLTCFGEISGDTLWVATANKGLGYIDLSNPEDGVKLSYIIDPMKTGMIGDMAFDNNGRLWCLTEKGLFRINTNMKASFLFDGNYGIPLRDSWSGKGALIPGQLKLLSDGRMVIGYRRGLGFFHPDSLRVLYRTPEPYFTSVRIFDKDISLVKGEKLELQYNENFLSLRYSAMELYHQGISFRHKLSGVDPYWHENPSVSEVTYPNLQPGSYQFKVQAVSESGLGETKEMVLNIQILPPWWKTAWAYVLFLLLTAMLFYVLYRFQLNRQLAHREARRLRELDELKTKLYANITHEFRTPITVIMGLAGDLANSFDPTEKKQLRKKLETIQRSGGNLLLLVNQMLDLAKLEHGKLNYNPIRSNIIPWLQYIVESHQSLAATREIQLTFYPETESLEMDYDPDQLSKVISNLLTNAVKFTEKRGKVICHAKYEIFTNTFHIKVKDTGIGIPEGEQSKIFDRFYQVGSAFQQNKGGTGIGLSLTKEIVEGIGGAISVKSQPGKGSEFEVVLPVTQNAQDFSSGRMESEKLLIHQTIPIDVFEEDQPETMNGKLKPLVLMAEDNPDVAGYIRDTIRSQYKVKWAPDGEKALQMAFDLIPDLVITDVMMPAKDGFDVCNSLKTDERTDHIPVIMLTAKVTDADRISGYERGADAYLTKPFNKKELLVRMDQLLRLRKQLQAKFGKLDVKAGQGKSLSPEEQFILKAVQIVEANLEKSMFHATDLASEVHLSESQLYRKLKAISGKSTAIFIRTVRLKIALELLQTSTLSISEIAYQVGFNDPAWFSRVFKEEFGMSPTEAKEN